MDACAELKIPEGSSITEIVNIHLDHIRGHHPEVAPETAPLVALWTVVCYALEAAESINEAAVNAMYVFGITTPEDAAKWVETVNAVIVVPRGVTVQ